MDAELAEQEKEPGMTEERAKQLYEAFSQKIEVRFSSYFKYNFTFKGENDQIALSLTYNGGGDIYSYEVDTSPLCLSRPLFRPLL